MTVKNIAFDLGASSGKMMLGEFDGKLIDAKVIHRFPNSYIAICNGLYWNILNIYQNMITGIEKAYDTAGSAIESIGIDSFCNDFGLIGSKGDLINQIRCYRDERTARCAEKIYSIISKEELYQKTGVQIALFNTAIQMAAMVLEGEGFLLDKSESMLLIPDLLGYMLTGVKRSEYTLSSVTQLFDYKTCSWHKEIMSRFHINPEIFPEIIEPGQILGKVKKEIRDNCGFDGLKVVAVAGHDTASAVCAVPSNKEHVAYISSGTWSIVGTEVMDPIINQDTYRFNFSFEGGVDHRYRMLKNVMGLWLIQEAKRDLERKGQFYSFEELNDLALREEPFRSLIDPDDGTFYMPGNMLEKIRDFCFKTNQKLPETPGQFIRTILESLALKYRFVLEKLEEVLGYRFEEIHILGGGGQNKMLNRFVADATGKTVFVGPIEAALYGNLMTQLRALGEIKNLNEGREIISKSCNITTYEPDRTQDWNSKYEYFKTLLK